MSNKSKNINVGWLRDIIKDLPDDYLVKIGVFDEKLFKTSYTNVTSVEVTPRDKSVKLV